MLLVGVAFAIQYAIGADGYVARPARASPRPISSTAAIGGTGAKLLLLIAIGAQLFCGMSSVTANSRMIYAFSRDGALPGSRVLAPGQPADPDAHQRDLARAPPAR